MRLLTLLALISLILPVAYAQEITPAADTFDPISSYDWLNNNTNIKTLPARESAFALLALNNQNYDIKSRLNEFIASQKSEGCWPRDGCAITDTALGLLVLENTGQDTNKTLTWLLQREVPAGSIGGSWYIQIVTTGNGTCDVTCEGKTTPTAKVDVTKWTDINTLCGAAGAKKSQNYYVDCADIGDPGMHITLLYNIEKPEYTETFLLQDEQVQQMDVDVNNACFPKALGGSACDLESTLYATWVLKLLEEEVHTVPFLEEKFSEIVADPLKLALLYMALPDSTAYGDKLVEKQKPSGSWVDDVYKTSIAAFSLVSRSDSYINATAWLKLKRDKKDFSWNQKVMNTAVSLIAIYGTIDAKNIDLGMEPTEIEICDNLIDDDSDVLVDCDDSDCFSDVACMCDIATDECASDSDCAGQGTGYTCDPLSCTCTKFGCDIATDECVSDSDCYTYGTDYACDLDLCACKQQAPVISDMEGICDDGMDDDNDGDIDCNDSDCEGDTACEKSYAWLWFLLIILIALGFGGFYYFNYAKKGRGFGDFKNDVSLFFAKLFRKKAKKTSFEEHVAAREREKQASLIQQPVQQKQMYYQRPPARKKEADDELEKSLAEAKKLLGK